MEKIDDNVRRCEDMNQSHANISGIKQLMAAIITFKKERFCMPRSNDLTWDTHTSVDLAAFSQVEAAALRTNPNNPWNKLGGCKIQTNLK